VEILAETGRLLEEISAYCRNNGIAESTFGRLSINDGKLMSRLRTGGGVTEETSVRIRAFMQTNRTAQRRRGVSTAANGVTVSRQQPQKLSAEIEKIFRFYDNRQKYLMFVTTSNEKWVVADRAAAELDNIVLHPPALRLFDAGVGEGSVLARLMRAMHDRFPTAPFYIVGKEISPEDVRLTLEKMPDRFCEHPATVLVMTNLHYAEAPWLAPHSIGAATSLVWHELALAGGTGHDFERQISDLEPFLATHWRAQISPRTGNPVYEKPVVLVIYRNDYRLLLDSVLPRRGAVKADFDFVLASQPYRARASAAFKAKRVIAPLARALGPGGRLLGIHSYGKGPALEIIQRIWPDDNAFATDRHHLLHAVKSALGADARRLNFLAASDARALFRYDMHTLPHEISGHINTSTLLAAWNAATYVAQIDDDRLSRVISHDAYLEATRDVLLRHGGLWFWDESYVISRRPGLD